MFKSVLSIDSYKTARLFNSFSIFLIFSFSCFFLVLESILLLVPLYQTLLIPIINWGLNCVLYNSELFQVLISAVFL